MDDWLAALLLGIIEGITEFLPISSTGHLLVAQHWLGARSDLFNIGIQSGAIVAVALIYRQRLLQLARDFISGESRDYVWKLAVAFGITVVLGLVVAATDFQLPETVGPVAWALVIGGFWMLAAEHLAARKADNAEVSWRVAILVGLAQIVAAIFPGTSRSGATIFVAMLAGTSNRAAATEFAFLLGIPTLLAATVYQLLKALQTGTAAQEDWTLLGIAFLSSTVTAFIAVKWLLGYIVGHRFTAFAFYRIILGVALLLWLPH
ncbi:MAG: undecaprenyl-diphosphate phosphatase [Lysobacteraceae bacterium]